MYPSIQTETFIFTWCQKCILEFLGESSKKFCYLWLLVVWQIHALREELKKKDGLSHLFAVHPQTLGSKTIVCYTSTQIDHFRANCPIFHLKASYYPYERFKDLCFELKNEAFLF